MAEPIPCVPLKAETLTPLGWHSLAVPSGTASLPELLGDRAMAFAVGAALGALRASPLLPHKKDYTTHMRALPALASVFLTDEPRLMRPLACRLNLDTEGGLPKQILDATSTGNQKTYFFIQEIPPRTVFRGALFGLDPFEVLSRALDEDVTELVVRTGLRRTGLVRLTRDTDVGEVRLNVHTAKTVFGIDLPETHEDGRVERYVLHDFQLTGPLSLKRAAEIVADWRPFPTVS